MSAVARTNLDTRTEKRYEALTEGGSTTGTVKGVDASDGFSRKEAKLVKSARRRQKNRKMRANNAKLYDRAGIPRSPGAPSSAEAPVAQAASTYVGVPSGSRSDVRRRRQNRRARRYARRHHNPNVEPPS